MAILKLQDGGAPVALFIQHITDDVSRKPGAKAQYKFAGRTADDPAATLWVFAETAERQFKRIGLTRDTAVGKSLEFSKTAAGYVDINMPATRATQAASLPSALPSAAVPTPVPILTATPADAKAAKKEAWQRSMRCYAGCIDEAIKLYEEKLTAKGVPLTHEGIATCAASLFAHCFTGAHS